MLVKGEWMIEIKNNTIYFYHRLNSEVPSVNFPCLSAYVCPHCKLVLLAYYAGLIQKPSFKAICEDPADEFHYTFGSSKGGQYLELAEYIHKKKCTKWKPVSLLARGAKNSVKVWLKESELNVSREAVEVLARMVEEGKVPGFQQIADACGTDQPITIHNEMDFFNGETHPEFDEYMARKKNPAAYIEMLTGTITRVEFEERARADKAASGGKKPDLEAIKEEMRNTEHPLADGPVIDVYTRAEAIKDGVLIDISEAAGEAGIVYPAAITQAVWDGYIVPPEAVASYQDINGRLWDLLTMFTNMARAMKQESEAQGSPKDTAQIMRFKTLFEMAPGKKELIEFKAVCGPGDTAEPMLTIMLPGED